MSYEEEMARFEALRVGLPAAAVAFDQARARRAAREAEEREIMERTKQECAQRKESR